MGDNRFVIQKHAASRLHYDFRLELNGVLKSWAIPKGPSIDPDVKRLAVQVEDHPLEYGSFEGTIPEGEYGGGTVMLWDRGSWKPEENDPVGSLTQGTLKFTLKGKRLRGGWALVRMKGPRNEEGKSWLLIKERDDDSQPGAAERFLKKYTTSISTGRTMDEIRDHAPKHPARNRQERA